jgi:hypothetical protein
MTLVSDSETSFSDKDIYWLTRPDQNDLSSIEAR